MSNTTPAVVVMFHAEALPGLESSLSEHLNYLAQNSVVEDGCIGYEVQQNENDPSKFLVMERWASVPAYDLHTASVHVQTFNGRAQNMIAHSRIDVTSITPGS
jgi:quinol monooxygenase YgiN